jgi:phosphoribosylformimino-5-aminoimidazole carboxamide ribonucleotide (ProFAR) isomerase
MYNGIVYSVNLQKEVKKYVKRIFLKLDTKIKKKIIQTWIKNGEVKRIYELG